MKFKITIISTIILFLSACASQVEKENEENSLLVVERWSDALSSGDIDTLLDNSTKLTKAKYSTDWIKNYWMASRESYGKLINKDLQLNWKLEIFEGNLPDGTHRRIVYWNKYEKNDLAKETFIVTREGGEWKVHDWYVR
jgi:hypothetical protein